MTTGGSASSSRSAISTEQYHLINLSTILGAYNPEKDEELWRAYKNKEYSLKTATALYLEALIEEGIDIPCSEES